MATSTEMNNIDHRAPDVRHLVYSMYRKMLTGYNDQANEIVNALPRDLVQEDADIYRHLGVVLKQQSGMPQTVNDSPVHGQGPPPPPPPPPSFPGGIAGRRLKTEIPQKNLEPPAAIQNAMLTKDKKPFTYTPGGIDLSEIRSPRMARRINRNAQADEMPGIPAPTTNHHVPVDQNGSVNYSAMQSQLPSQVLPPVRTTSSLPPPPPPPPSESAPTQSVYHNRQNHSDLSTSSPQPPKTSPGKPGLPFDPNELFARVNKSPAYEPVTNHHVEPPRNFKNQQPAEDKMNFVGQQRPKSGEIDHNVYVPLKTEPVQSYPTSNASKLRNEPGTSYLVNQPSRNQTAPTTLSSSAKNQENVLPSATPFGNKIQINQPLTQQSMSNHVENKPRVPWATAYKTPQSPQSPQSPLPPQFSVQSSVNRGPESPKAPNTRIIPIQVETENVPKSPGPGTQTHSTSPPSFMQSPQLKQQYAAQQYATQQYSTQQQGAQQYGTQQQYQRNQQVRQQGPSTPEQHSPNVRIIPVEIEGGPVNQNKPAVGVTTQNKFNPMSPTSPTPYSPSYEKDQKPQWASVQSKAFKKEPERLQQQQQQQQQKQPPLQSQSQPVYNSAGVPLSQLRKMQLSEDDRALMDKFKSQVDDETYLHRESDPRYRGGVIPSRAFRILQSMTDTAGDVQQSAPRSPPQTAACNRSFGGTQYYQEPSQGPNVPPSEQQVQEPRKYTGGSIPSRSFRMLQAMTGQEMSASNSSEPSMGRETPISDMNRWCSSPSPSFLPDPYWAYYYFSDPYLMYNYLHGAYGLPPPPPPPPSPLTTLDRRRPPFLFPPFYKPNDDFDRDDQDSYCDELAQYYSNYLKNMGYCSYQSNKDRPHPPTPVPFKVSRACGTHTAKESFKRQKMAKITPKTKDKVIKRKEMQNPTKKEDINKREKLDYGYNDSNDESSEQKIEFFGEKKVEKRFRSLNGLQSMKSISNINMYAAKNHNFQDQMRIVEKKEEIEEEEDENELEEEMEKDDVNDDDDDDDVSTTESFDGSVLLEPNSNQLSVIPEESEESEVESFTYQNSSDSISTSESCSSTIANESDEDANIDANEEVFVETEPSITVPLSKKAECSQFKNGNATKEIVFDNATEKYESPNADLSLQHVESEESFDDGSSDISVTFTLPSRSNSTASTRNNISESKKTSVESTAEEHRNQNVNAIEAEVETAVTIRLFRSKVSNTKSKIKTAEVENCRTSQIFVDSEGKFKNEQTIVVQNGIIVESEDKGTNENKVERNSNCRNVDVQEKDDDGNVKTPEESQLTNGVNKLSPRSSLVPLKEFKKKDFLEESEEDDSGVTSDMSLKHVNSETDGETESDYSELSKMTQFQRASTHSRLYKLLQEEYEKCEEAEKEAKGHEIPEIKTESPSKVEKEKSSLPIPHIVTTESISDQSRASGMASTSSSSLVTDQLVKELIHSLLNSKNGKKFKRLSLAKLHAAALRILEEEMDGWETENEDGGLGPSQGSCEGLDRGGSLQTNGSHSKSTMESSQKDAFALPEDHNTLWICKSLQEFQDCDLTPSKIFRTLIEQTNGSTSTENCFKIRCPRVASKKNLKEVASGRSTPVVVSTRETEPETESMSFAEKQKIVAKVFEKS